MMGRFVCPHCGGGIEPTRWAYRIESGFATTEQQTWPTQGARPAILPDCQPQLERIAALERDRALLLEYLHASEPGVNHDGESPYDKRSASERHAETVRWRKARQAVIDAGLLEGDDQ